MRIKIYKNLYKIEYESLYKILCASMILEMSAIYQVWLGPTPLSHALRSNFLHYTRWRYQLPRHQLHSSNKYWNRKLTGDINARAVVAVYCLYKILCDCIPGSSPEPYFAVLGNACPIFFWAPFYKNILQVSLWCLYDCVNRIRLYKIWTYTGSYKTV